MGDPIFAEISEIKTTHASNTPDPLRKPSKTPRSITKTAKKIPIVSKSKSAVQDSEDEAEKRRERVRKCRRKKKESLVADNIQREANIARMNQELAQMSEIIAAHNCAQPDAAASLLSSLLEEISEPEVSTVL